MITLAEIIVGCLITGLVIITPTLFIAVVNLLTGDDPWK